MIEPSSGPEAEERAYEEAVIGDAAAAAEAPATAMESEPAGAGQIDILPGGAEPVEDFGSPPQAEAQPDDDFSPFVERDFVETRRRRPLTTILVVLVLVAALAVAFWFYAPPPWKARLGLADSTRSPLLLANPPHMELTPLESGNQLLTVAGRIINPTGETQPIPPIYAQFRNRAGKVVYSWTISPPAPSLAPGESKAFNSAEVNVPPGAQDLTLEISLGSPKA